MEYVLSNVALVSVRVECQRELQYWLVWLAGSLQSLSSLLCYDRCFPAQRILSNNVHSWKINSHPHVSYGCFRDTETSKGTQTVQPIVLVELDEAGVDVKLDATSERYRWISLCPLEAEKNGEDRYILEALNRLKAWNPNY